MLIKLRACERSVRNVTDIAVRIKSTMVKYMANLVDKSKFRTHSELIT